MSKTIVFVHGAWVTPLCWEKFSGYCEGKGYTCIAPAWPHKDRSVEDIRRDPSALAGLGIAIVAVVLLELFMTRTYWGKALRATAEDWAIAALTGIDIRRIYVVAFAISAGLAGITGVLIAVQFSVSPSIGLEWTLKALIVVVLAGLGSIRGTLLGGILLGVAEAISSLAFGGEYREIVGLLIFLIFLSFRPQGLFGGSRA